MPSTTARPPLHTVLSELVSWTFLRTADIPKSHRFTIGQRIDNLSLDGLLLVTRSIWASGSAKKSALEDLNLQLELLRVLWRLVHEQRWISQQQLIHVMGRIDEAGRMTGGWLRQLEKLPPSGKRTPNGP